MSDRGYSGGSGPDESGEDTDSPEDSFAIAPFDLITEQDRAAILQVLATQQAKSPQSPSMAFSDLREAAGIDDSGNFNYHLNKLQPGYVRQTEDGYRLTNAALLLVGILQAGVGVNTRRESKSLEEGCPICDAGLTASYEDSVLTVACENRHKFPKGFLPPNAVDGRSYEEIIALQTQRALHNCELVRKGICPACFDDVSREHTVFDSEQASHAIVATCENCGRVSGSPVGMYLLREPPVVAFYYDHGVDVTETPLWALDLLITEPIVQSEEPLRLSLSVQKGGETLRLVVDKHAHLLDSERVKHE